MRTTFLEQNGLLVGRYALKQEQSVLHHSDRHGRRVKTARNTALSSAPPIEARSYDPHSLTSRVLGTKISLLDIITALEIKPAKQGGRDRLCDVSLQGVGATSCSGEVHAQGNAPKHGETLSRNENSIGTTR